MCFLVFLRHIWRNRKLFCGVKYIVDRYVGISRGVYPFG
jgi:hypothetical protein